MLLPYEYKVLLITADNEPEVVSILSELDNDCILVPEGEKRRETLLQRLKSLGERRIYERLTGQRGDGDQK